MSSPGSCNKHIQNISFWINVKRTYFVAFKTSFFNLLTQDWWIIMWCCHFWKCNRWRSSHQWFIRSHLRDETGIRGHRLWKTASVHGLQKPWTTIFVMGAYILYETTGSNVTRSFIKVSKARQYYSYSCLMKITSAILCLCIMTQSLITRLLTKLMEDLSPPLPRVNFVG